MSLIFDIKRYSINDGPGIRLTIFFKGCPLSCIWCHNPEGIKSTKEKLYNKQKCLRCQTCVSVCPNTALAMTSEEISTDATLCTECGTCTEACPTNALEISGREMGTDEIMKAIERESFIFDQSDGGVTFCGGEPLLHRKLLLELLGKCGIRGIHRAVDSSLYATEAIVREVASNCDLILADIKLMDPVLHKKYTGESNELILSNIRMLAAEGFAFIPRIPLIEGINADEKNIKATAIFLSSLPGHKKRTVELLPYHDIATGKHTRLGTIYNPNNIPMARPSDQTIEKCVEIFREKGVQAIVK